MVNFMADSRQDIDAQLNYIDSQNGGHTIPTLPYTVNIYRYKAIGANATSNVILYTGKCISPCLDIL